MIAKKTADLCQAPDNFVMNLAGAELPTPGAIRFSVLRSPERLPEILELRRVTHQAANKISPHATAADMTDPRDRNATMVIAESAGRIIGAIRLTPPIPGTILHCNCRLEGPALDLPPKSDLVEVSWACIHPDHQSKGLFWHLAAHMLIAAEKYGRPYLVGASQAELYDSWRRCGYRKTDVSYVGAVTGIKYWVMLLDLEAALTGRTIAPKLARVLMPLLMRSRTAGSQHRLKKAHSQPVST